MEGLTLRDPVEQIRAGYADVVTALSASLEARDGYTLGHGERVSALAVMIGHEMRLPAGRLRAMAQGALLHDVEKIGIPDRSLAVPQRRHVASGDHVHHDTLDARCPSLPMLTLTAIPRRGSRGEGRARSAPAPPRGRR